MEKCHFCYQNKALQPAALLFYYITDKNISNINNNINFNMNFVYFAAMTTVTCYYNDTLTPFAFSNFQISTYIYYCCIKIILIL